MWYIKPWRIFTLFIGVSILYYGALTEGAPDWDVTISFIMAFTTYALMPVFEKMMNEKQWVGAAAISIVCSDTTYSMYWDYMGNAAASQVVNFPASLSLFLMCWLAWSVLPQFVKDRR